MRAMMVLVAGLLVAGSVMGKTEVVVKHTITKKVPKSGWLSSPYRYFFDVYNPTDKALTLKLKVAPRNSTGGTVQPASQTKTVTVQSKLHAVFFIGCEVAPDHLNLHGEYGIKFFEVAIEANDKNIGNVKIPTSTSYEDASM
jgi:hypothetical protein